MVRVNDVLKYLFQIAPAEYMESWDNIGHLIGRRQAAVTKLLLALDITPEVIKEAQELKAELIVSHHPIIIDKINGITDENLQGELILSIIESGISAICMHTNLDKAPGGVDETFAKSLGLNILGPLTEEGVGFIGLLEKPLALDEFMFKVKEVLKSNGLRFVPGSGTAYKVASGCGSCGDYVEYAIKAGCDTFVTADVKYDQYLTAKAGGMNIIDAGHFPTENVIIPILADKLRMGFPGLVVFESAALVQPERFYI